LAKLKVDLRQGPTISGPKEPQMTEPRITDFHAHIYFDADELERARALAGAAQQRFGIAVGHFHQRPVGPHPRGSVQMTVPTDRFGEVATWLAVNRAGLTIFAHASTGDDRQDHSHNVVWFGPSEELNLSIFD
jgi:aromatic ring-cleaving dioxygenase